MREVENARGFDRTQPHAAREFGRRDARFEAAAPKEHLHREKDGEEKEAVSGERTGLDVAAPFLEAHDEKIEKEVEKAAKRFGDSFEEKLFRKTNPRVLEHKAKRDELHARYAQAMNDVDLNELRQIILDYEIVCPISGTKNWTDVRQFNLMFSTEMGSTADGSMKVYLRPETAQGIFVNFLNVQKTGRMRIPFGIAQIGKAFRNEIVARQFIFRMREFEQMEMQFFVRPGEELKWFAKWKETRQKWHKALG